MKKTYEQVVQQIATLQVEAEKLRRGEIDGVIKRIRDAITFYKLSASDLGLATPRGRVDAAGPFKRRKAGRAGAKPAPVVKYRNETGGTWGGIGKRPQWLRDELTAGKTLQDFLVK
jgi:DNA-binding protein H-NS